MNETLLTALALIPALIVAIVFHEVAHGWTALMLGDPTAKERKRLSLNPIRHVDPIGTVVLPGVLALTGAPVFGWAKPVPVNKWRLNNPRFGMMAVAAAGPGTNLVLAAIGAALLGLFIRITAASPGDGVGLMGLLLQGYPPDPATGPGFVLFSLFFFITINIFLALFNLLPIPPFDGSHIVEGLLPEQAARTYDRLRPFGFPLLFLLLLVIPYFFPELGIVQKIVLPPVMWVLQQYLELAAWFVGI